MKQTKRKAGQKSGTSEPTFVRNADGSVGISFPDGSTYSESTTSTDIEAAKKLFRDAAASMIQNKDLGYFGQRAAYMREQKMKSGSPEFIKNDANDPYVGAANDQVLNAARAYAEECLDKWYDDGQPFYVIEIDGVRSHCQKIFDDPIDRLIPSIDLEDIAWWKLTGRPMKQIDITEDVAQFIPEFDLDILDYDKKVELFGSGPHELDFSQSEKQRYTLGQIMGFLVVRRTCKALEDTPAYIAAAVVQHEDFTEDYQWAFREMSGRGELQVYGKTSLYFHYKRDMHSLVECQKTVFVNVRKPLEHVIPFCDQVFELDRPTPNDVIAACRILGIQLPSNEQAEQLIAHPIQRINEVCMRHRSIVSMLKMLADMSADDEPVADDRPKSDLPPGPYLEDLHGYGSAASWAQDLKRDLADFKVGKIQWADVDRGILLSGPPGVGKTVFASALARSTGSNLVLGSYGRWAAGSGQTDLLKRMRKSFDDAKKSAPCILFIDEIDSFTDRDKSPDWHAQWSREVVNALLECIDGTDGREGVIIVGACNNPGVLDPAIVRAGRLDKHVEIPLPDLKSRGKIIEYHLKQSIPGISDLMTFTEGFSGADLEQVARSARRSARRAGEPVTIDHLKAAFPPIIYLEGEELWHTSIHEIGHAIVGQLAGMPGLDGVHVKKTFMPNNYAILGYVKWNLSKTDKQNADSVSASIQMHLGGIAAEQILFGQHSTGCSQDLQKASALAFDAIEQFGFGGTLSSVGEYSEKDRRERIKRVPELRKRIDAILAEQLEEARAIIRAHRPMITELAKRLADERYLSPDDVIQAIEGGHGLKIVGAK